MISTVTPFVLGTDSPLTIALASFALPALTRLASTREESKFQVADRSDRALAYKGLFPPTIKQDMLDRNVGGKVADPGSAGSLALSSGVPHLPNPGARLWPPTRR
ncbi:hypothetical protein ACSYDW_06165 [Paeniglutamicibacter sp. R2-26]|uniref:hypothetical protein n=1 Tax=Paeniglutamicibacter sp. R2-26 TaxID=3144417 RepID=UPI003EE74A84